MPHLDGPARLTFINQALHLSFFFSSLLSA